MLHAAGMQRFQARLQLARVLPRSTHPIQAKLLRYVQPPRSHLFLHKRSYQRQPYAKRAKSYTAQSSKIGVGSVSSCSLTGRKHERLPAREVPKTFL